jgi:hypothetical protein
MAVAVRAQEAPVPRLVNFSGVVKNAAGAPQTGTVAITFSFYEEQEGGTALWSETQNLALDGQGRYTVLLGAAQTKGLPLELFASGKARWLAVTPLITGTAAHPAGGSALRIEGGGCGYVGRIARLGFRANSASSAAGG